MFKGSWRGGLLRYGGLLQGIMEAGGAAGRATGK